jgi:hypothetical protein
MYVAQFFAAATLLALSSSAYASRLQAGCAPSLGSKQIQVQVNFSASRPASDSSDAETPEASVTSDSERLRRRYYELAVKECEVLLSTIAAKCQLANISVSSRDYANPPPQSPMTDASLSATFSIELK